MPADTIQSALPGHYAGEPHPALTPQPPQPPQPGQSVFGGATVIPLKQVPLEQRWDTVEQAMAQTAKICAQVEDLADSLAMALVQLQEIRRLLVVLQGQQDRTDRGL